MRTVNGLKEARAALAGGARVLVSPPGAGAHAGVAYYAAMLAQLRKEYGDFSFTLCCGDDPAIAHEALRLRLCHVICRTDAARAAKLAAIAEAAGLAYREHYPLDATPCTA